MRNTTSKVIERAYDHLKVMSMGKLYILRLSNCTRTREDILNGCKEEQKQQAIPFGQTSLFN